MNIVQIVVIVVLVVVCIGLDIRLYILGKSIRSIIRPLRAAGKGDNDIKLRLSVPGSAEEELLEAVNGLLELRRSERAAFRRQENDLRRQIANVSHDLRTPLTSILGYLQLLEGENLTKAERSEYLNIVKERAQALQALITSFYDLTRLEGGEYPLTREPVDLRRMLGDLIAAFYGDFTQKGMEVSAHLADNAPAVYADANAVTRVFTNLIGNALKHGNSTVTILLYRDKNRVITSFSNEAPGLKNEDVAHLFDRFYTADKMRSGQNTGLGLAIVKALVEQMGHRVAASLNNGIFTVSVFWKI
ncbi:Adaptive-response sensory-kinase SasA [bioreactor metagenome]|uniref:histidine kinase n=1 Tax=bioreactor metagenome TaxID=1076179 RepID=A0A644XJH6_9ZZZZ